MNRKAAVVLMVLLAIFAVGLVVRLSVTLGHWLPLGRDGPYQLFHTNYLIEHYPSDPYLSGTPPVFFHFAAWNNAILSAFGASRITAFDVATALASGLVALTTFLMMRRMTKSRATALAAAFFSAFVPGSLRMMGELQKNSLAVSIAPLAILFFWRGLDSHKKLDLVLSGIMLGVVGLTHELVFGTLVIAYVSYLALLLGQRRRIPWRELKAMVIVAIAAGVLCGWFYYSKLSGLGGMTAGTTNASFVAQGGYQPPLQQGESIYRFYDEYVGRPLLALAVLGGGVAVYRRKAQDLFILAWGLSALVMAQPWVVQDYQWRLTLMLATAIVPLAAVGLVEGIGAALWKAGADIRGARGRNRGKEDDVTATWLKRGAFMCLALLVVASQAVVSNNYAWTCEQIQPAISMNQYNALENFRNQFGEVIAFGGDADSLYWIDAVGLKGSIQAGEVIKDLSELLMTSSGPGGALALAVEWYDAQQEAGENIYALGGGQKTQALENEEMFTLVFSHDNMRVYALNENFVPPENYRSSSQPETQVFSLSAEFAPPQPPQPPQDNHQPPQQPQQPQQGQQSGQQSGGESIALKILMAPVYVLPSWASFVIGVPLTVLLWVFLPCLAWEGLRRVVSEEGMEKLRKAVLILGIIILVLVVVFLIGGSGPTQPQMSPPT
jgi:hypothetical protein